MYHVQSEPTTEILTLAETRIRLGIMADDDTTRDDIISEKIRAARQLLEVEAGSVFSTRSIIGYADSFTSEMKLLQPLQSVQAVKYVDVNGVTQTLSPSLYYVDLVKHRVVIKPSSTVPATSTDQPNAVSVEYTSGFSTVPQQLKEAIYVVVGQWEIHQEGMQNGTTPYRLPYSAIQMLNGYRDFRNHV